MNDDEPKFTLNTLVQLTSPFKIEPSVADAYWRDAISAAYFGLRVDVAAPRPPSNTGAGHVWRYREVIIDIARDAITWDFGDGPTADPQVDGNREPE